MGKTAGQWPLTPSARVPIAACRALGVSESDPAYVAISHNGPVATGKRAGSRRSAQERASFNRPALAFALAITACLVAWGYLVYLAIDFGTSARAGDSGAWAFLVLSSLGAVACLFAGLLFVSRLIRALGLPSHADDERSPVPEPTQVAHRAPGGRRAAR